MAFGISRRELSEWKAAIDRGELAFLTHYWLDPRFPGCKTVTKVGCADLARLAAWCEHHDLPSRYIHKRLPYPHFDLLGPRQGEILLAEGQEEQVKRFGLV